MSKIIILIMVIIFQTHIQCYALSVQTHSDLNEYIVRNNMNGFSLGLYLRNNLGLQDGITTRFNLLEVWQWFRAGGEFEDLPAWYLQYLRSVNHFHNPSAPSLNQAGFSGIWDTHLLSGMSAILWSQSAVGTQSPGGFYSWNDARNYFYNALTSTVPETRNTNSAETFRGLGQLMHLVQDMSVPEHARNDGHYADAYEEWVRDSPDSSDSERKLIVYNALANPKYPDMTVLNRPSPFSQAPVPIANLFDTKQYDGSNPAATVGLSFGLSEYANANFFTADTIFRNGFPYPAWSSVSEYDEVINLNTGKKRTYLRKVADGEQIEHAATGRSFFKYLPPALKSSGFGLKLDGKVYADYAQLLLPRSVGYSASLLNYFFRGTIELTLPQPANQSFRYIRLKAKNITANGEEMSNPEEIKLVVRYKQALLNPSEGKVGPEPVPPGEDGYHYLVVPLANGITTIPKDTPVDLEFDLSDTPLPLWSRDVTLQVVYKGQLGNETGAVAVGRIELPSIHGDIQLALPDKGIYGITTPNGSFSEFRLKATNTAVGTDAMSNGGIELFVHYKRADADPFQSLLTGKSPLDQEYYYLRVSEKNGVNIIPRGTAAELVFDLSAKPLPIWATDVSIYIVYTGQIGTKTNQVAIGYQDIAEPSPIDIINNMDHVCINGSYLSAGSQAAIDAVGTDGSGRPISDIYPHRLKDVYLSFSSTPASATNFSAKIPDIEPGQYGRVFLLTDHSFKVSSSETVENIYGPLQDIWGLAFGNSVENIEGVLNQTVYENGGDTDYYPGLYTERALLSWWSTNYENPEWPTGTTCDSSRAQPNLAGPVAVEIPQ